LLLMIMTLGGCGGSSPPSKVITGTGSTDYAAGVYNPSSSYASRCAIPRKGTDPVSKKAYTDIQGSAALENFWLRSWTHELYLWYKEVPDLNPNNYTDPVK